MCIARLLQHGAGVLSRLPEVPTRTLAEGPCVECEGEVRARGLRLRLTTSPEEPLLPCLELVTGEARGEKS